MRTTTKTMIAALSVVALLGVGLVAAQTTNTSSSSSSTTPSAPAHHESWLAKLRHFRLAFHRHPVATIDKVCDGNMTVDECKAALKDKLQDFKDQIQKAAQQRYEQCLQTKSKDYCDGRLDQFKADHPRVYGNATAENSTAPA